MHPIILKFKLDSVGKLVSFVGLTNNLDRAISALKISEGEVKRDFFNQNKDNEFQELLAFIKIEAKMKQTNYYLEIACPDKEIVDFIGLRSLGPFDSASDVVVFIFERDNQLIFKVAKNRMGIVGEEILT